MIQFSRKFEYLKSILLIKIMKALIILASLFLALRGTDTFNGIPKILWTFWDSGLDNARLFTKMCVNNMAHYTQLSGWEFRFLTNENYTKFISEDSFKRINQMYSNSKHVMHQPNWADIIRLFLVYENGGMWLDTNSYFIGNLSWIEHLQRQAWAMNRITKEPQVITFSLSSTMGGNKTIIYDDNFGKDVYLFPGLEIWSFISKPKSKFLTDVVNRLEYILGTERSILDAEAEKEGIKYGVEKDPYFVTSNYVFQTVLQKKQHELESSPAPSAKYAVQHYQLWTIPAEPTIFGIFVLSKWFIFDIINTIINESLESHISRFNIPPFMIKFNGLNYRYFEAALTQQQVMGCLSVDGKVKNGSLFEEFMMRPSSELPEIKHINQLYAEGSLDGSCERYTADFFDFLFKVKAVVIGAILTFLGLSAILLMAVKRRIIKNNAKR